MGYLPHTIHYKDNLCKSGISCWDANSAFHNHYLVFLLLLLGKHRSKNSRRKRTPSSLLWNLLACDIMWTYWKVYFWLGTWPRPVTLQYVEWMYRYVCMNIYIFLEDLQVLCIKSLLLLEIETWLGNSTRGFIVSWAFQFRGQFWDLMRYIHPYCWWKKSCTSWYGKYLIICRISYNLGSAAFLPSTVCTSLFPCWIQRLRIC